MIAAPYVKLSANVGRIVLFACLFFACLLGAIHVLTPPNPDSAIFDYIAWRVLSGDRLYVDVLEQNWPGAVWIHMVSSVTFGNTWWSFRLFDYLLMLQASVALFWMGRQSGLRWTGWIAAALYPVMYLTSSPWMTGQRDAMAAHILISSAVLYLNLRGQWRGQGMFVFGLLCALSVMIRPTYLLFPVLIVILDAAVHLWASRPLRPFFRSLGYAVVAFITFIAIVAAQGARTGGLTGWWESAILYNLMVYSGSADFATYLKVLVELFKSWHWYIVFGTIGSLLWLRAGDRWIWSMVMALAFTCLVSFVVQGKGFGYHLSGLLPVLALFAAHLIAWAVETVRARIHLLGLVIAVLLLTVALAGTALKLRSVTSNLQVLLGAQSLPAHLQRSKFVFDGMSMNDLLQVSNHIRAQTTTDETLLVWNRGVWINFLAERKMPVPFATVGALAEFKDPTLDMARRWLSALDLALKCSPPAFIVVGSERGWTDDTPADEFPAMAASDRMVLKAMQSGYRLETQVGGAQLWRRASKESASCPR